MRPIILTIAGSDCSGGAGIQADLQAIVAHGGYAATALTAVTVQNTRGVHRVVALAPEVVREQLDSLGADLEIRGVKTGMLANRAIVETVAAWIAEHPGVPFVCDPVVRASDGASLLDGAGLEAMRERLLPLATVVTPNLAEAVLLAGREADDLVGARAAAEHLVASGIRAVVLTGGHRRDGSVTDLVVTSGGVVELTGDRVEAESTHGTGCVFSAALVTLLARGVVLERAASLSKAYVAETIRNGHAVGSGTGPVAPLFFVSPFAVPEARRA